MNRSKLLAFFLCFSPSALLIAQPRTTPSASTEVTQISSEGRLYNAMMENTDDGSPADARDRQVAKLYRDYARYLELDPAKDHVKADAQLRQIMQDIKNLVRQPGVSDLIAFRDVYRTILRESKDFFGKVDSSFVAETDEIYQLRAEVFSEIESDDDANLLENVTSPLQIGLAKPTTVFPMDLERPVMRAIASLAKRRDHWNKVRTRADIYFPMMERIMAEEGLPEELKYLSVVESALNPRAQSWAAAAGLWQFIPATGGYYGLDINRFVDERRDPEKATRAAARHIKDLNQMFDGDWQLALAGYNCNPYRVKRVQQQASARLGRKATFWDIMGQLPRETRDYVPLFIATFYIMNNQESFDLGAYPQGPSYEYEIVSVPGDTSLDSISERLSIPTALVRALNPELRLDKTPPSTSSAMMPDKGIMRNVDAATTGYMLRVPKGSANRLGNFALSEPVQISYGTRNHRLAVPTSGFNMAAALPSSRDRVKPKPEPKQESVKPEALGTDSTATQVTTEATSAPIADLVAAVPAPKVKPKVQPKPKETAPDADRAVAAPKGKRNTIKVKPGQTLTNLAEQYGVSAQQIKEWNGLRYNQINVGQRLVIFSDKTGAEEVAIPNERASNKRTSTRSSRKEIKPKVEPTSYRVQRGETLAAIAKKNGISLKELKEINNIKGSTVQKGDILRLKSNEKTSNKKGTTKTSAKTEKSTKKSKSKKGR